jgi:hypothetical protein
MSKESDGEESSHDHSAECTNHDETIEHQIYDFLRELFEYKISYDESLPIID